MLEINPILSILSSLLIINGIYNLAKIMSKSKYLIFLENYAIGGRLISFFLITNFLSIILYNFFLLFGINEFYLKISAALLILIGFYKPDNIQEILKKYVLINTKTKLILFLIVLGYFFISLLPITDPDSLDYHLTFSFLSLINKTFFIQKEWFTSQLAGAGEALIIFGLSINAYKLSSILQFLGLFSIIIAILKLKKNNFYFDLNNKILISLMILCIPCFLFLTFTAKPQLFPIGTNFIAFLITFFILPFEKNDNKFIILFSIISFLCISSTQFKFSFFLSSGIILLFAFFELLKRNLLYKGFLISIIFFFLIIFPREFFDYQYLSQDILKNFFSPATDEFAAKNFITSLKHGTGNSRYLPYWIFLPFNQYGFSMSVLTDIIGLSVLFFLVNFKFKLVRKIVYASLIFFIFALLFGQPTGRFFIEPFLWLSVGSIYYLSFKKDILFKLGKKLLIINSLLILASLLFTIVTYIPGIFSIKNYKNILLKYADGYSLYDWANKNLPDNSTILSTHRSYLFSKNPFISYNFRLYVSTQEELDYYKKFVVQKKPTHFLYSENDHNNTLDVLKNCRGNLILREKNIYQAIARNPFNNSKNKHDGYIYEVDLDKIKKCKISK